MSKRTPLTTHDCVGGRPALNGLGCSQAGRTAASQVQCLLFCRGATSTPVRCLRYVCGPQRSPPAETTWSVKLRHALAGGGIDACQQEGTTYSKLGSSHINCHQLEHTRPVRLRLICSTQICACQHTNCPGQHKIFGG